VPVSRLAEPSPSSRIDLTRHRSSREPGTLSQRLVFYPAVYQEKSVKLKSVYLILCMAGLVLPYWQFLPWLTVNGMNFTLFFHQLLANRISAFFGMDVLVSAVALMTFVHNARPRLSGIARWLPLITVLTVGVSLALPLFLYLREENATAVPIKTLL
jgi:hypothetical protein